MFTQTFEEGNPNQTNRITLWDNVLGVKKAGKEVRTSPSYLATTFQWLPRRLQNFPRSSETVRLPQKYYLSEFIPRDESKKKKKKQIQFLHLDLSMSQMKETACEEIPGLFPVSWREKGQSKHNRIWTAEIPGVLGGGEGGFWREFFMFMPKKVPE